MVRDVQQLLSLATEIAEIGRRHHERHQQTATRRPEIVAESSQPPKASSGTGWGFSRFFLAGGSRKQCRSHRLLRSRRRVRQQGYRLLLTTTNNRMIHNGAGFASRVKGGDPNVFSEQCQKSYKQKRETDSADSWARGVEEAAKRARIHAERLQRQEQEGAPEIPHPPATPSPPPPPPAPPAAPRTTFRNNC